MPDVDADRRIRPCGRCGRTARSPWVWAGQAVCRACTETAMRIHGRCPRCATERLLPGLDGRGQPVCADCAGITQSFRCLRCGREAKLWRDRTCTRCILRDQLAHLLDDGTGHVPDTLRPLLEALASMPIPDRGLMWIRNNSHVGAYLRGLATGHIPLTHAGLTALPSYRTAAHLRDLLMHHGVLPQIDRRIPLYEYWVGERLRGIADPEHARLLRRFATWYQLPKLREQARHGPLNGNVRNFRADQFIQAARFLTWLDARGQRLAHCSQADLDTWYAQHPDPNERLRGFLRWAMADRAMPTLAVPSQAAARGRPISRQRRLDLLRRVLTDDTIAVRTRVVATLVLLYAQPVSRLVRLTVDDLIDNSDHLLLRIGDPPSPVPQPVADLLRELAANRANMNTAANPDARWLFPGGRAGQPLTAGALLPQIRSLGVPTNRARTAALRQLVLQAPAPVIAQALGYSQGTAHRHLADAGATWSRYSARRR